MPDQEIFKVYAVVDVVDYEGRYSVAVFSSREQAERFAQRTYRGAVGRLTVDELDVLKFDPDCIEARTGGQSLPSAGRQSNEPRSGGMSYRA